MSAVEQIENVILGGGEAGKYIAWELAKLGRPTLAIFTHPTLAEGLDVPLANVADGGKT